MKHFVPSFISATVSLYLLQFLNILICILQPSDVSLPVLRIPKALKYIAEK